MKKASGTMVSCNNLEQNYSGFLRSYCKNDTVSCHILLYNVYNIGTMLSMLVQHCINVIQMFCVFCGYNYRHLTNKAIA